MLESKRIPSSPRISNAQRESLVIEKNGARCPMTFLPVKSSRKPVCSYFMPCFFDRFDYFGMFFGDNTENEECCLRSYFIQNLQQFSTDNRNSVFKSVP